MALHQGMHWQVVPIPGESVFAISLGWPYRGSLPSIICRRMRLPSVRAVLHRGTLGHLQAGQSTVALSLATALQRGPSCTSVRNVPARNVVVASGTTLHRGLIGRERRAESLGSRLFCHGPSSRQHRHPAAHPTSGYVAICSGVTLHRVGTRDDQADSKPSGQRSKWVGRGTPLGVTDGLRT